MGRIRTLALMLALCAALLPGATSQAAPIVDNPAADTSGCYGYYYSYSPSCGYGAYNYGSYPYSNYGTGYTITGTFNATITTTNNSGYVTNAGLVYYYPNSNYNYSYYPGYSYNSGCCNNNFYTGGCCSSYSYPAYNYYPSYNYGGCGGCGSNYYSYYPSYRYYYPSYGYNSGCGGCGGNYYNYYSSPYYRPYYGYPGYSCGTCYLD